MWNYCSNLPSYQIILLISGANKILHISVSSQLVRVMVSPVNSPGATASCQKSMYQCGLLQQLCTILMATGVPADILTEVIMTINPVQKTVASSGLLTLRQLSPEYWDYSLAVFFQTINTVSEVIRGSQVNQDYFASVNAPSNPPR